MCAGDFARLAIVARVAHSSEADELQHYFDWFQLRAISIEGDKAIKTAMLTAKYVSSQAETSGMQAAIVQEVANTTECVPLVTRLLPETKKCFESSVDSRLGTPMLTYKSIYK